MVLATGFSAMGLDRVDGIDLTCSAMSKMVMGWITDHLILAATRFQSIVQCMLPHCDLKMGLYPIYCWQGLDGASLRIMEHGETWKKGPWEAQGLSSTSPKP